MRRTSMILPALLLAACVGEGEITFEGADGDGGARPAFRAGKADAASATPDTEREEGPSVITTDGAHDLQLPPALARAGRTVARIGVGGGDAQLGVLAPTAEDDAGDGEGPRAIGVDGLGRVFLLDTANDRVVRLSASGVIEARFPLEAGSWGIDLGVGEDGSFAVLALRESFHELTLFDAAGLRVASTNVADAITPVTAIFVDGEEKTVLVEHDELRVHTVIGAGAPLSQIDQATVTLYGAPTLGGSLGAAIVGDHTAIVRRYDADGVVEVEATIQADRPVLSMPLLRGLPDGRIIAVLLLQSETGAPLYYAVRLTQELAFDRAVAFTPAVLFGLSRDLAVSPDGKLFQLKVTGQSVEVAVHFAD